MSLHPKGIFKLPLGSQSVVSIVPLMARPSPKILVANILRSPSVVQWDVEKLANGNYIVKNGGDIVGGIDRKLFAILIPEHVTPEATEWTFRLDETRMKDGDAYM